VLLSQYNVTRKETLVRLDSDQKPTDTKVNVYLVFPGIFGAHRVPPPRRQDNVALTDAELKKVDEDIRKRIESEDRKRNQKTLAEREKARAEKLREEERILDV